MRHEILPTRLALKLIRSVFTDETFGNFTHGEMMMQTNRAFSGFHLVEKTSQNTKIIPNLIGFGRYFS